MRLFDHAARESGDANARIYPLSGAGIQSNRSQKCDAHALYQARLRELLEVSRAYFEIKGVPRLMRLNLLHCG